MKSVSGFAVLLLVAFLVILPVTAFGYTPDNWSLDLDLETKIGIEEEVAAAGGEMVVAYAADPSKAESDLFDDYDILALIPATAAATISENTVATVITDYLYSETAVPMLQGGVAAFDGGKLA